jgi:hypothetical protein
MSRINVDVIAFTDARFAHLATLLGLADADHARSKVEYLWWECTLRGTSELPQWVVEAKLGAGGPDALMAAQLARWAAGRGDSKTRLMHICGASERCLWLVEKQEQSSKGGKARASSASRAGGKFTSREPAIPGPSLVETPPAQTSPPAPAPAPAPAPERKRDPSPPEPSELLERRALRTRVWNQLNEFRREIASELGEPHRPLHPQDPGERELAARILECGESAAESCEHVLAVFAAEARTKRTLQHMSGAMFRAPSWSRAVAMSVSDAERADSRSGRFAAKPAPVEEIRKVKTL